MSWKEKRSQVRGKLDQLATQDQNTMSVEQLQTLKQTYEETRQSLSTYLTEQAQNYQLSSKLEKTGELQQTIKKQQTSLDKMKTDVETALARDDLLRSRDRTGNNHTLYLLDRPVRRGMVPYLWVLSVLFVGIGVLFFYLLTPIILLPTTGLNTQSHGVFSSIIEMLSDIFYNRLTWMALFGAASIVILFLSLKIAGVFGK